MFLHRLGFDVYSLQECLWEGHRGGLQVIVRYVGGNSDWSDIASRISVLYSDAMVLSIWLSTNYEEAVDSPSAHGQLLAVLNSCIVLSDAGVMAWYVSYLPELPSYFRIGPLESIPMIIYGPDPSSLAAEPMADFQS